LDDESNSSVKSKLSSSSSSNASWTISFHKNDKNEPQSNSKIKEKPKVTAATSVDSSKGNCGFYVDFGAIKEIDVKNPNMNDRKEKSHKPIHEDLLRKSTGFYIDFSSDHKAENGNGNKKIQSSDLDQIAKSKTNVSLEQEKKNIFSMFVDISGDEKFSPNALSSSFSKRKCSVDSIASTQNEKKLFERTGRTVAEESHLKDEAEVVLRRNVEMNALRRDYDQATKQRHSWTETEQQLQDKKLHKRSISVSSEHSATEGAANKPMNMQDSKIPFLSSKTSSMNIDSSMPSPMDDFSSKSLSSNYSNNSVTNSNSSNCGGGGLDLEQRKRRKDAKINETFDKSSVGSITDGILSSQDENSSSSPISTTTDTDDVTFQNNLDNPIVEIGGSSSISTVIVNQNLHHYKKNDAQSALRSNPTMDPIIEQHDNKSNAEKSHTMETL
jgi:BTB/POZ domain-containing protein 8